MCSRKSESLLLWPKAARKRSRHSGVIRAPTPQKARERSCHTHHRGLGVNLQNWVLRFYFLAIILDENIDFDKVLLASMISAKFLRNKAVTLTILLSQHLVIFIKFHNDWFCRFLFIWFIPGDCKLFLPIFS